LEELPDRAQTLAIEIGELIRWVWPFFQASRTGMWNPGGDSPATTISDVESIDEDAPQSLSALSDISALSIERLREIEDALLTKQQIVCLLATSRLSVRVTHKEPTRRYSCTRTGHMKTSRRHQAVHS